MKTYSRSRNRNVLPAWAACAATCFYGGSTALGQDAAPASAPADKTPKLDEPAKTEADYRNWFDVSVGANFVHGDKAAFKERHNLPQDVYGGVSDFHYEQDVGKKGLLEVDGRGIFDNNDYELRINLENPDIGYVRGGYREFRTWYDGSGGYLPVTGRSFSLSDEEFFVDRGELWFEGGLTLPEKPALTFRYSHQFRDGRKDSTIWGDAAVGPGNSRRGIVPTFLDIDEERDIFQLDAEHTLGDTHFGVGLRYEASDQNDSRNIHRRPGEAADRYVTQREILETDLFNVHAFQETWFTDTLLFTTGYSFTQIDTDLGGSRIYGPDYDSLYDPFFARRQERDEGFLNLIGGSKVNQHVMNLNLMFTPWENVTIVPSLRAELQDQTGIAEFDETNVGGAPTFTPSIESLMNTRDRSFTDVTEGLEARYTGFTNWVLYARGEWLQGQGDLSEREITADTGTVNLFRDTDSTRFTQKYAVGANWYPLRRLNLSGQYYHKTRENEYDHIQDSTSNISGGNRYPAFIRDQDFTTDDVNFRITLRPWSTVSIVSRYDFQLSTVDSRMDNLARVESSELTSHIFSESITWTPIGRLFLQGSINYTIDRTRTPADGNYPNPNLLQASKNNYVDANVTAGYALTQKTDLQAQYFIYYADNFQDNSAFTVPYGVSAEEHGITGTLIHRISAVMQWTLKYGWYTFADKTYGGRNDYDAHMIFSSYRFRF